MSEHYLNSIDGMRREENKNAQHARAIDGLVHELGLPAEDVNRFYREILDEFRKDIKVEAFLPIIVSRVVRARLQQK
jgi:hypothetical protein